MTYDLGHVTTGLRHARRRSPSHWKKAIQIMNESPFVVGVSAEMCMTKELKDFLE